MDNYENEMNEALARKVLQTVDAGLVRGLGLPNPGQMCVEAAVNYALGAPHGDKPACVGPAVRAYKIRLNDQAWSSDAARAKGLRALAVAQLGSDKIDQRAFADYVVLEGIKRILPIALRASAKRVGGDKGDAIAATIAACENATDLTSARTAAKAAHKAAAAYAAYAASAAYAAYAAAAAAAADAAAADAADAADAAADAAAYAAAYARDNVLSLAADIGVEALMAQGCQGCEWLWLVEKRNG